MKTDPHLGATLEASLESSLKELKMEDLFHASRILKHWELIVGENLARHCMPGILKKGVLQVLVPDGMYKKHLQLHGPVMLDLIRNEGICPANKIYKLDFIVDSQDRIALFLVKKFHPKLEEAGKIAPTQIDPESKEIAKEQSAKIQDPALRKAFSRMMARRLSKSDKNRL